MTALLLTAHVGLLLAYCEDMQADLMLQGVVVVPSDNDAYAEAVQQYAFSSMPTKLHPSGIVYAEGAGDVEAAVRYAWQCDYRVVVRSGGHQYSGLSSCDSNEHKCMQVDMSKFTEIAIDGTAVRVGSGVSLDLLYTTLAQHGLFVGGGECGTVHVGGHVQTGGYGRLLRSFGVLAEHVTAFDIVLADGGLRHVVRPVKGQQQGDADIYWAVLGGGAGSWGIVTEYTLEVGRDADYPHSTYYHCVAPYGKQVLQDMLSTVNVLTKDPAWLGNHNEALWMTILKAAPFQTNIVHFEGVWVGLDNTPFDDSSYSAMVAAVAGRGGCSAVAVPLSLIMSQFTIYKLPREFPFPYFKRSQVSTQRELGDGFAAAVAEKVDSVMAVPGVFLVSQIATGGGVGRSVDISLPMANGMYSLGFDVFYSEQLSLTAKADASSVHSAAWEAFMQLPAFIEDSRFVWSTFGDLKIEDVWQHYYETTQRYNRLRAIKSQIDPFNLFRTSFTIPPFMKWPRSL